RREPDAVAGRRERQRERRAREAEPGEAWRLARPEKHAELRRRARREVGAPPVDRRERSRRQRDEREVTAAGAADEAGLAQHASGRIAAGQPRLFERD